MAALSALRSRFFVPLCYTKRAPLRSGCEQFATGINGECHPELVEGSLFNK
nr:hypothetical protein [uncultured organism]